MMVTMKFFLTILESRIDYSKLEDNGKFEEIDLTLSSEAKGLGTGAAVADIDKDGVLELLIAHGETGNQILTLYKANIKKPKNFLRIKALNKNGAPARGATVTLTSNLRKHSKTMTQGLDTYVKWNLLLTTELETVKKILRSNKMD